MWMQNEMVNGSKGSKLCKLFSQKTPNKTTKISSSKYWLGKCSTGLRPNLPYGLGHTSKIIESLDSLGVRLM